MYDDVESSLNVPSIEITGSANTTPSHRPINSPLPDLPPTPNDASATQTSTASKAKTLIKGTFKDVFGGKGKKSKPTRATSPMPTGNMVMKCGHIYMYKKHTFGGGVWEKRYCVITGEGNLYYSNTDDDADCKGKIPLRGHTDKMKTKDAHGDKKVEEHPYLMLLARNTFAFTADKDRHEWMEDIKYSTCESLEIDSEEEDEVSGGYNVQCKLSSYIRTYCTHVPLCPTYVRTVPMHLCVLHTYVLYPCTFVSYIHTVPMHLCVLRTYVLYPCTFVSYIRTYCTHAPLCPTYVRTVPMYLCVLHTYCTHVPLCPTYVLYPCTFVFYIHMYMIHSV